MADSIGEQATECSSQRSAAEEEGDSELPLTALIPHREVVDNTREESTFGNAKEKPRNEKAGEIVDDTHQRSDNSPCDR